MKALVIGRDGMLGSAICAQLASTNIGFAATTRRHHDEPYPDTPYLDLCVPDKLDLRRHPHDVLFLVAAITKVVDCEASPQSTWMVNADAPVYIAGRSLAINPAVRVVFISSDAVSRAPSLNYSRQKAYVESYVLARGGAVVRPARIAPDRVQGLAALVIRVGSSGVQGLICWE